MKTLGLLLLPLSLLFSCGSATSNKDGATEKNKTSLTISDIVEDQQLTKLWADTIEIDSYEWKDLTNKDGITVKGNYNAFSSIKVYRNSKPFNGVLETLILHDFNERLEDGSYLFTYKDGEKNGTYVKYDLEIYDLDTDNPKIVYYFLEKGHYKSNELDGKVTILSKEGLVTGKATFKSGELIDCKGDCQISYKIKNKNDREEWSKSYQEKFGTLPNENMTTSEIMDAMIFEK
tara:strand:+ start:694 stop:1392 length:699 start_codon:yes stop_codon:yes gene_type:complete